MVFIWWVKTDPSQENIAPYQWQGLQSLGDWNNPLKQLNLSQWQQMQTGGVMPNLNNTQLWKWLSNIPVTLNIPWSSDNNTSNISNWWLTLAQKLWGWSVQAAEGKMSIDDFANQIKSKYPQYSWMDNNTLAQNMINKYPVYADKVDMSKSSIPSNLPANAKPIEKKEDWILPAAITAWTTAGLYWLWQISKPSVVPLSQSKSVTAWLVNKLLWWVKTEDAPLVNKWIQTLSNIIDKIPWINTAKPTFSELASNWNNILSTFYKQSWMVDKLSSFSLWYNKDAENLLNSMKETLTTSKWWVKLWMEDLYNNISSLLTKAKKWTLNWMEATQIKGMINDFFRGYTPTWNEPSWITAQWARNIYNRVKTAIENKWLQYWINDIKDINNQYQWLLEAGDYITKQADKINKLNAITEPQWLLYKVWKWLSQKIWNIADLLTLKTWKPLLQWVLSNIFPNQSTVTVKEIEDQMPTILKQIKQLWSNENLINDIKSWLTKGIKSWKVFSIIDPMYATQLTQYVPWTIGKVSKQYVEETPYMKAATAIFWWLPTKQEVMNKLKTWELKPTDLSENVRQQLWIY